MNARHLQAFRFIAARLRANTPPNYQEINDAAGFSKSSVNGAVRIVKHFMEWGLLVRQNGKTRSFSLTLSGERLARSMLRTPQASTDLDRLLKRHPAPWRAVPCGVEQVIIMDGKDLEVATGEDAKLYAGIVTAVNMAAGSHLRGAVA